MGSFFLFHLQQKGWKITTMKIFCGFYLLLAFIFYKISSVSTPVRIQCIFMGSENRIYRTNGRLYCTYLLVSFLYLVVFSNVGFAFSALMYARYNSCLKKKQCCEIAKTHKLKASADDYVCVFTVLLQDSLVKIISLFVTLSFSFWIFFSFFFFDCEILILQSLTKYFSPYKLCSLWFIRTSRRIRSGCRFFIYSRIHSFFLCFFNVYHTMGVLSVKKNRKVCKYTVMFT